MPESPLPGPRTFNTTHWSLVGAAQSDEASRTQARLAIEELCRAYWYPLYAFVRNRGHSSHDAQDLTQSFLVQFIEAGGFAAADRQRGRFRTYLLGALKHFLANDWHRAHTQKRGGHVTILEWDALNPEARYALEPHQPDNPETDFDRGWALELTARTQRKLRAEMDASGKSSQFETLKCCLTGNEPLRTESAQALGMSEGAVKVAIHRLRQRYRTLLRDEIAQTVAEPSEIDDEMRHLVAVLRRQ